MNSSQLLSKSITIFFDLDGTLIDSAPDLGLAADKMRVDRGLPSLPQDLYRPMAGAGARGMLKVAFDMSPEHALFLAYREEFFANYAASITALAVGDPSARTFAFSGINEMLRGLEARGFAWGIVTNKSKRFTDPLVAALPVLHGACAVVSGDSTPHSKPHPAPLLEACRLASQSARGLAPIDPARYWYLGDDKRDIDAGHAAGMTTIAVTWGYEGEHALATWGADHVLHKPTELLTLLD